MNERLAMLMRIRL